MSKRLRKLALVFVSSCCLAFGFQVLAQDQQVKREQPKYPRVKPYQYRVKGEPLRVIWPDGREATLNKTDLYNFNPTIPLTVYENQCTPKVGIVCNYKMGIKEAWHELKWSKHPDSERVGKVVLQKFSNTPEQPVSDAGFGTTIGIAHALAKYPLAKDLIKDSMSCQNWQWVNPNWKSDPDEIKIDSFTTEFMFQNPETGVNENLSASGARNLILTRKKDTTEYQLTEITDFLASESLAGGGLINGDIITMQFETENNKYCSVSFKPDFSRYQLENAELENSAKATMAPYLYDENELFKFSFFSLDFDFGGEVADAL